MNFTFLLTFFTFVVGLTWRALVTSYHQNYGKKVEIACSGFTFGVVLMLMS